MKTDMLGAQQTKERVRRFKRAGVEKLQLELPQWYWAIDQAIEALSIKNVDSFAVRLSDTFVSPTLNLLVRRWSGGKGKNQEKEMFESINKGTILTFPLLLASSADPTSPLDAGRPPSIKELEQIFSLIGEMLGLSPWGSKFGYGRFRVESLKEISKKNEQDSKLIVGRECGDRDSQQSDGGEISEYTGEDDGVEPEEGLADGDAD